MLLLARRMDASGPMFAHLDLATADGGRLARIAEETKDRATAERCADALDGLPPKVKADYFGAGTVIPEVVGALAAAGNWEQALALIRAQPRDFQKAAIVKLANMPIRPSCFRRPENLRVSLARERCLSGQDAGPRRPAAGGGILRRDGEDIKSGTAHQRCGRSVAETGNPAAALPLANAIADPVLRARALAAVADALKS